MPVIRKSGKNRKNSFIPKDTMNCPIHLLGESKTIKTGRWLDC
ncbi:hypothetical protein [Oxalobacter vibrioformis]|nr:hypothetical protein [Oxalobacter vibrioformis]